MRRPADFEPDGVLELLLALAVVGAFSLLVVVLWATSGMVSILRTLAGGG